VQLYCDDESAVRGSGYGCALVRRKQKGLGVSTKPFVRPNSKLF
jgi:hypothetical protein